MDGLTDPLNDPLPGQRAAEQRQPPERRQGRHRGPRRDEPPEPGPGRPPAPVPGAAAEPEWSGDYYRQYAAEPPRPLYDGGGAPPPMAPAPAPRQARPHPDPAPAPAPAAIPPAGSADSGVASFVTQPMPVVEPVPGPGPLPAAVPVPAAPEPRTGGRAERRRAAAKSGGRGRRRAEAPEDEDTPESGGSGRNGVGGGGGRNEAERTAPGPAGAAAASSRPLSRLEARRAARALKESPAVIASRAIGELFISFGVLMLLFVTYQLWWTNIRADQIAGKETNKIQSNWAEGRQPGNFAPGQGFAIMHIPKLDVVVPIAEGISKAKVLDQGMVGHYAEGTLKTAMPSDKQGNFAVAGHRNTHGEPFRYINRLQPGDKIIVETQNTYYTYDMTSILPQTPPSNVSVITPVPPGSGFTKPGRYITLTTCTPEFTSTYRLIVWGKMVEERPRSKGKPDALVG
ncbi:class E sortase [Streptomyces sp. NPDC088124]|uniref:class E sortase n=1 Tax=Streptomyces sp. NPDC088124 TaxID=3154654 RepID=UPI00341838C0